MTEPLLVQDLFARMADSPVVSRKVFLDDGVKQISYGEFYKEAVRVALAMRRRFGVRDRDRVLVVMPNCVDCYVALLGTLVAGAIAVPIADTVSNTVAAEIAHDSDPRLIIVADKHSETLAHRYALGTIADLLECNDNRSGIVLNSCTISVDPAFIMYTSGSIGGRKGVVCSHDNVVFSAMRIAEYLSLHSSDVVLSYLQPSFDYGLYQFILAALAGATLKLRPRFLFADEVIEDLSDSLATVFPLVPPMASRLVAFSSQCVKAVPNVRLITSTGAAFHDSLIAKIEGLFPSADIVCMYGLTECKRVSYLSASLVHSKPGSVGKPMRDVAVRVVDAAGEDVEAGNVGELVVRGRNVALGYWAGGLVEDAFCKRDSLGRRELFTGDLFRMDEEGYLYWMGRKDDMVKVSGHRVCLGEIESVLMSSGLFSDVLVEVAHDALGDAFLEAWLVLATGERSWKRVARSLLIEKLGSAAFVPRRMTSVESLEINENGKHQKGMSASLSDGIQL